MAKYGFMVFTFMIIYSFALIYSSVFMTKIVDLYDRFSKPQYEEDMKDFSNVMTASFWICVVPVIAIWLICMYMLVRTILDFTIIMY